MSERYDEMHEQELSDRFDRGDYHNATPEEHQVLVTYQMIRERIKQYTVPGFERLTLLRVLKQDAENMMPLSRTGLWSVFKPVFVYGGFVSVILLLGFLLAIFHPHSVQRMKLTGNTNTVSMIWKTRLQWGKTVTIPKRCEAELLLADGSIVSCSPETSIAIHYTTNREIDLHRGAITVHATHKEDSKMVIQTPLLKIQVVGTVFHVEITE